MGMGDPTGEISTSGCESFIVVTDEDFGLSVQDDEPCPRCGANDKVRGPTGRWQCRQCNRTWNRKINAR